MGQSLWTCDSFFMDRIPELRSEPTDDLWSLTRLIFTCYVPDLSCICLFVVLKYAFKRCNVLMPLPLVNPERLLCHYWKVFQYGLCHIARRHCSFICPVKYPVVVFLFLAKIHETSCLGFVLAHHSAFLPMHSHWFAIIASFLILCLEIIFKCNLWGDLLTKLLLLTYLACSLIWYWFEVLGILWLILSDSKRNYFNYCLLSKQNLLLGFDCEAFWDLW